MSEAPSTSSPMAEALEALMAMGELLEGMRSAADNHRKELLALGWSETAAEAAAIDWLIVMQHAGTGYKP